MISKSLYVCLLLVFLQTGMLYAQSWIRINQLGYTPHAKKVAVLGSKDQVQINDFNLCNALTDQIVYAASTVTSFEAWGPFVSSFRLDFSSFARPGAYYLMAGGIKSPVFRIAGDVYDGTADFLLRYMRQQRCGYNPFLHDSCHTHDGYTMYHPTRDSSHIDVRGGWHDATDYLQYTATSANAVYQLLFAYQQNPTVFGDCCQANGEPGGNGIPDVIDEAKWGLEWLLKMNPDSGEMYNQIADDRDHRGFRLPNKDSASYGKGLERPVYFCTGKPQGVQQYKNRANGISSTAGKFSSAFALGAIVMRDFDVDYGKHLSEKAIDAFTYGVANPGACQTAPCTAPYFYEEDNWTDDMELAGAVLYQLTGERHYLDKAIQYGRQEVVTPWMGADTARHYQWYPFLNMGHWNLAAFDSQTAPEFLGYWKQGIDAVFQRGKTNPFLIGIPFIWCSNNLVTAMITQCHLYALQSGDHSYDEMEAALRDWLFGCNPWGTAMIVGMPLSDAPSNPHSSLSVLHGYSPDGGLVDGPVYNSIFSNLKGIYLSGDDEYAMFQSRNAVYHDDYADYSTNEPTMDGTADLTYYLSAMQSEAAQYGSGGMKATYSHGGIIRGDRTAKKLALVFTGHEFADGFETVYKTLKNHKVQASFFFTGDFYRNPAFEGMIRKLVREKHYLGAHSDKHLLYCDWIKRDSLLVNKVQFLADLKSNYASMKRFGIEPQNAGYFLPPYEWYNDSISDWCRQYGIDLVNFTPGTSSNQDWTYPALGYQYAGSDSLYAKILAYEKEDPDGLNGFILLLHVGTDPGRTDKFYSRLEDIITQLKRRGYTFVPLHELIG